METARGALEGLGPDFVVSSVNAPTSVYPWKSFTASVVVCNQGTDLGMTDVALVASVDEELSTSDTVIATVFTSWLSPGQCVYRQVSLSGSVPEGSYYLGAIADPSGSQDELEEQNNTRLGGLFGVGYRPEFVIRHVEAPAAVLPGASFNAAVTVCNEGTMVGGTSVALSLSPDGAASQDDVSVASLSTGFIETDTCVTLDMPVSIPWSEGTFHLLASVGPSQGGMEEFFPQNNVTDAGTLGVGFLPDFVTTAVTVPASAEPTAPFTTTVTVCNQGTAAGSTFVNVFLSPDADISEQDLPLAAESVGFLAPGECATRSLTVTANVFEEGAYYVGAIADVSNAQAELVESNNVRASSPMGVGGSPDFVVTHVSAPASLHGGETFTASFTVCNQGIRGGDADVLLSLVAAPEEATGTPLQTFFVGFLDGGQCATRDVSVGVGYVEEGVGYVRVTADASGMQLELIESNNARLSDAVTLSW